MKFFVDFEALQFSEYIISIGCACENGNKFATYVKPPEGKKLTDFITKLTGITEEKLAVAPTADEAFNKFFDFILRNNVGTPEYFCYGDSDIGFIRRTMHKMTDTRALTFAESIAGSMKDYSPVVKRYFSAENHISLRKIYTLVHEEEVVQNHDALEDAEMLAEVVQKLKTRDPSEKAILMAMPKQEKPYGNKKKAPEIFVNWPKRWKDAKTYGTPDSWKVCAVHYNGQKRYFDSLNTAVLWMIRYFVERRSPKKEQDLIHVEKRIKEAVKSGKRYYDFTWSFNDEEEK